MLASELESLSKPSVFESDSLNGLGLGVTSAACKRFPAPVIQSCFWISSYFCSVLNQTTATVAQKGRRKRQKTGVWHVSQRKSEDPSAFSLMFSFRKHWESWPLDRSSIRLR